MRRSNLLCSGRQSSLTLLFLWLFLHDTQAAPSLQQTYLLGMLLFGSFLLFAAYRTLYLGLIWVRYFSMGDCPPLVSGQSSSVPAKAGL